MVGHQKSIGYKWILHNRMHKFYKVYSAFLTRKFYRR